MIQITKKNIEKIKLYEDLVSYDQNLWVIFTFKSILWDLI